MGLSRPRLLTAREAVRSYGVATAFLPSQATLAWIPLVALAMFGANRAIGNLRLALVCAAGHVLGTLVSEGIAAYRIDTGRLPSSWAHIIDVGPSYVLVSAIVVAVLLGSVPAKVAALADFAVLVVLGHIFADLSRLHVAPIGHADRHGDRSTPGGLAGPTPRRRRPRRLRHRPGGPRHLRGRRSRRWPAPEPLVCGHLICRHDDRQRPDRHGHAGSPRGPR